MGTPTRGAIAAGHPQTVEAGLDMLRLGGNAFDAAAAAIAASFVTEPGLTSAAGGGFLLAHTADNTNTLFDFFTQTPWTKRQTGVDFYPIDVDFGTTTQQFHIGLGSMAVPGAIAGLCHMHQTLGRLPLQEVFQPAIHLAQTGALVNDFQAYCFDVLGPILLRSPTFRSILMPNGQRVQSGDTIRMPDFAQTLKTLADEGADYFYRGAIADQLVRDCHTQGGHLTLADLDQYQVMERSPLSIQYRGKTLLTNPPPSSGGTLIAFALQLLEQLDVGAMTFGSNAHIEQLAKVMQLTNWARTDGYDANLYQPDIAEQFLSETHRSTYQGKLAAFAAQASAGQIPEGINKWGSTTHISVIDGEGNAASVTASNGEGSAYAIPGTGIMVNNMLGEADLHPHGFHQWPENVRISSMMAPTIVLDEHHRPEIVLGSGGSNRIRTAILQVLSNLMDFQLPIDQAVHNPRIHWEQDVMGLEPGFADLTIDRDRFPFNDTVEQWDAPNMFFGGVHAVVKTMTGDFDGAGDRRRGGIVSIAP